MKWVKSIVSTVTALITGNVKQDSEPNPIDVCMLSDVGCCRSQNEDAVLFVRPVSKTVEQQKGILTVLADGMGGHQSGQIASRMAVDLISDTYYKTGSSPMKALENAFADANTRIFQKAGQNDAFKGMGTTITALVLIGDRAFICHVGDSRLYRIRNNEMEQLTEDHTVVYELVKQGIIRLEDAQKHPDKNLVTRAMGTRPQMELFTKGPIRVLPGDHFILCSDGLYELVKDEELKQTVLAHSPHEACKRLILSARANGGYDNISIGVITVISDKEDRHKTMTITRCG